MENGNEPHLYTDDSKVFKDISENSNCEDLQKDIYLIHKCQKKMVTQIPAWLM